MPMARRWNGMTIQQQKDRAAARALISMGVSTATETKRVTHKVSGTLARSVHAAPAGYEVDEDREEDIAKNKDMLTMFATVKSVTKVAGEAIIEVGSWLPYACAEWVGRGHPGVTQGLENARSGFAKIVAAAFREEGM